jgi:hypothetical protein
MIWNSMCFAFSMNFSRKTSDYPKADSDSLIADSTAIGSSAPSLTIRIPFPPTPSRGLYEKGMTDIFGGRPGLVGRFDRPLRSREHRNAALERESPRVDLVPQLPDRGFRRPDEFQSASLDARREGGVL